MARRLSLGGVQQLLKTSGRQAVRLVPILVIVGAIGWFFLLRSPGGQTTTSGDGDTNTGAETTTTTVPATQEEETKVADKSTLAATADEDGKAEDGKLPETGPAGTLALFAVTAVAGTFFWEWRQRRARPLRADQ